jgi:hypothetical protein
MRMMESDTSNADRAWWALYALGDFVNRTGVHDSEEAIGDLITNLLHLARAAKLDPEVLSVRSLRAMNGEVVEDDDGDMASVAKSLEAIMARSEILAFPWRQSP